METVIRARAMKKPKKDKKKIRERKPAPLPRSVRALLGYLGNTDAKIGGAVRGAAAPAQQHQGPTVNIRFELPPQMKQSAPEFPQFFQQEKYRKPTATTPSPLAVLRPYQQPQQPQQPIIIQQQPPPLPQIAEGFNERLAIAEQGLLEQRIQGQRFMAGGYELAVQQQKQQEQIESIRKMTKRGIQGMDDDTFDNIEYAGNPALTEGANLELPPPKPGQGIQPDVGMDLAEEYIKRVSSKPVVQRQVSSTITAKTASKSLPATVLEKRAKKFQVVETPAIALKETPKTPKRVAIKQPAEGLILEGQEKEYLPILEQTTIMRTPKASATAPTPKTPSKTTKEVKMMLKDYFSEPPRFKRGVAANSQRVSAEEILNNTELTPADKSLRLQELFSQK